ncbi:MAG TPA: hypothetical protein VGY66_05975 [Gemmataceae bacterium]|nr:hypothetical protein [Gemmataceae bacterium]
MLLVADGALGSQQADQGRAGRKAAVAAAQGLIRVGPGLARRLVNPAGAVVRPGAVPCVMGIGLGKTWAAVKRGRLPGG